MTTLTEAATPTSGAKIPAEGPRRGGVPAALQMRVSVPSAPAAAAGTDRTVRPSGLRLFTARAESLRLRDGFGLDGAEGEGGQEPDDWARTARPGFEGRKQRSAVPKEEVSTA